MDVFIEKIVKKNAGSASGILKTFIVIGAFCLAILLIYLFRGLGLVAPFAGLAVFMGTYFMLTYMNVEYEYLYTNGELDIDAIYSKKTRKRLLSVKCGKIEVLAPITVKNTQKDIKNKVYACSSKNAEGLYYAVFITAEKGKTILYFEPHEEMLEDLKKRIPRQFIEA